MRAIDTHCHLEASEFDDDRDDVIHRATTNGIEIITSAIEPSTWDVGLEIASQYLSVHLSIGLDPMLYQHVDSAVETINNNAKYIVAIGEIGLDHYRLRDHAEREQQRMAFEKLIELASTLSLPIQVHSRSAGGKALDVLYNAE
ncbi:MAG: TatD family hydrolase, partial [Candidatus Thorarchaeota archaeon]